MRRLSCHTRGGLNRAAATIIIAVSVFLGRRALASLAYNILGLFFTAGTRPAGPRGRDLAPGQCSWVDRGFRPGEPTILQMEVAPNVTSQLWFRELKDPKNRWTFYVFNTNQGVMKITHAERTGAIDDQP